MKIGQKIYELRTARNMSQGDLANLLEVSRQSVSKWETDAAVPDLDKLIKLADVFEVSLDELTGREIPHMSMLGEQVEVKQTGITQRQIIGYILLVASLIGIILTIVFVEDNIIYSVTIPFALITLFGSIICLCVKKNVGYSFAWAILSWLSIFIVFAIPVPIISVVLASQVITLILLAIIGNKIYKPGEIKISESKKQMLIVAWGLSIVVYMAVMFLNPGTMLWIIEMYVVYFAVSALITYTIAYIKRLKSHK